MITGGLQDCRGWNHHAKVNDLEVVAPEHDADNVLADVVHVTFHGGKHDASPGAGPPLLARFDKRLQVVHCLFHDPGALDDLGQEHLPRTEQVAHPAHAVHQRALDDVERVLHLLAGNLDVLDDEFGDSLDQGMHQPLTDGLAAPFGVRFVFGLEGTGWSGGHLQQTLGGVRLSVEDDVLHRFPEGRGKVRVDGELPRVDDRHVEAGRDGVVKEHRVHGLADAVVAAERKGEVGETPGHETSGQRCLDLTAGLEKRDCVVVVLLDAGGHGKDVGIEDDVLRGEADLLHQNPVRAPADLDLSCGRLRLSLFVEGHHHDGSAVSQDHFCLLAERRLTFLEADRVHDGLALDVPEARLQHGPA